MKKILFFLFAVTLSLGVSAQTVVVMKKHFVATAGNVDVAFDTVTNTGTNYLTNLVASTLSPGLSRSATIIWTGTRLSGTAGGTVTLQGSLDGTNFIAIRADSTATVTTFTPTNVVSQTTGWVVKGNLFKYYRVSYTGTGTMVVTQAAKLMVQ